MIKILLITELDIDKELKKNLDDISVYRVNSDNIFDSGMIVLDKYAQIIEQLYLGDGIFINTIFSFLQKLKSCGESLYYRQLHTKLRNRVIEFFKSDTNYKVYVYKPNCDLIEYLDVECFDYVSFKNIETLNSYIRHNI